MFAACIAALLLGAEPLPLDHFTYADDSAAAAAWRASEGAPPLRVVPVDGRTALEIQAPFAQRPALGRVVADRAVMLDLASTGDFRLTLAVDVPEAISSVTLYFRSGPGWYSCAGALHRRGTQTLRFPKGEFRTEGEPTGWDRIDGIRLAFWHGADRDAMVQLLSLDADRSDIVIVMPAASEVEGSDTRSAHAAAGVIRELLASLGLGADMVEEKAVGQGALSGKKLAILPLNPRLRPEVAAALVDFAHSGGKLFLCYGIPPELETVLGIGRTRYQRADSPGQFAAIRFDAPHIPGLPQEVKQRSWNIQAAEPLRPEVQVIAHWYDAEGNQPTGPALLAGPAGVYMSHVVLNDDPENKAQMLAALIGHLDPSLWREMIAGELERSQTIGPFDDAAALADFIRQAGQPEARARLAEAEQVRDQAAGDRPDRAMAAARNARELAAEAYLRSMPARPDEGRGFWEHSGLGAYPGDWDRTARELAAGGFNMIVPNMLWGGNAHCASDLLPRSQAFRQHGDQIAACVEAAHRHGLEVHVWKVNYNLGQAPQEWVDSLRQAGRLQVSAESKPLDWLCPSHPENLLLERDSMLEVARKYDVDGLHFDYIRYPDGDHCFCDGCRERFEASRGEPVANWPADCHRGSLADEYRAWRCEQITRLVATLSREARAARPDLKLSAAVFSAYPGCREGVGQDWAAWVEAGYLDFLCPMDYTNSDLGFAGLVESQLKRVDGRIPVYPGIGATASSSRLSADRVAGQIAAARNAGAQGFMIFNLDAGTIRDIVPGLGLGATATPAVPPHQRER